MSTHELLYLSMRDVETIDLPMSEIIEALEVMFKEKGQGQVEMPPKPGIHTRPDAFIHAMPAYIPKLESAGIKWVSGYPDNQSKGLPYISGLLILNDPDTGIPLAVMDASWITAMRTGAATAVAAKYLARPESSSIGMIACGVQGRSNLKALACIFKIETVMAFDIYPDVAEKYAAEMQAMLGIPIEVVSSAEAAVRDMDIVVTSGPILKSPTPVIPAGWLKPGGLASLVDFDSYWHPDAIKESDKFCTDDRAQLNHYQQVGYFKDIPPVHADLGELVVGGKPGRETPEERTIACNLGLAMDDMAIAPTIYHQAIKAGIGTWLTL